jgi:hypothetical protein
MAVLAEYVAHFNHHRPHRALSQAAPLRSLPSPAAPSQLRLRRRDLLGGLIHEYTPGRMTWMTSSAPKGFMPPLSHVTGGRRPAARYGRASPTRRQEASEPTSHRPRRAMSCRPSDLIHIASGASVLSTCTKLPASFVTHKPGALQNWTLMVAPGPEGGPSATVPETVPNQRNRPHEPG